MNRAPYLKRIERRAEVAGEFAAIVVVAIIAIAALVSAYFGSH